MPLTRTVPCEVPSLLHSSAPFSAVSHSKCKSGQGSNAANGVVAENVGLLRRFSSHLSGDRLVERNSYKTVDFSARKTCFGKRMGISDEPGGAGHKWVV